MDFYLGNALNTEYDDDGFPGVQIDLFGQQESGAPPFELHQPFGFFSTPIDPEKDSSGNPTANCCTALYAWEGSRGHAWLSNDPRITPKLPRYPNGSAGIYSAALSYAAIHGVDGTITIKHFTGPQLVLDATGLTANGPRVSLGVAPTGVATAATMTGLLAAIQALCAALQPFVTAPQIVALSAGTSAPTAAAAAALATIAALPTNFSQTVKAGA